MSESRGCRSSSPRARGNGPGKREPVLMFEGVDRTPLPLSITLCKRKQKVAAGPGSLDEASATATTGRDAGIERGESAEVPLLGSEFERLHMDLGGSRDEGSEKKLPGGRSGSPEPPRRVVLVLRETDTVFLLERPSLTEIRGTPEGDLVERDNEHYKYITAGAGSLRYKSSAEVQTAYSVLKNKACMASPCETRDTSASASSWDLYKTYQDVEWS